MDNATEWDETPEMVKTTLEERKMDDIPDGVYRAEVADINLFRGRGERAADWFFSIWFTIVGGVYAGCQVQRFLSKDGGIGYIKSDLRCLIGTVPSWAELVDDTSGVMNAILRGRIRGSTVAIRQRTRKKGDRVYVDVFLNKLIQALPESTGEDEDRAASTSEETTNVKLPTTASQPSPIADRWGDPDCPTCAGQGCDSCAPF